VPERTRFYSSFGRADLEIMMSALIAWISLILAGLCLALVKFLSVLIPELAKGTARAILSRFQ